MVGIKSAFLFKGMLAIKFDFFKKSHCVDVVGKRSQTLYLPTKIDSQVTEKKMSTHSLGV